LSDLIVPLVLGVTWWQMLLTMGFLIVSIIMILVVLVQKPQGGGLAGAFGSGAGSGQTVFGSRTGDALTIATISVFVVFIVSAMAMTILSRPTGPSVVPTEVNNAAPVDGTAPAPVPAQAPGQAPAAPGATPGAAPDATPVTNPVTVPPATPVAPAVVPAIPEGSAPAAPSTPAPAPALAPAPAPVPAPAQP